MDNKQTDRQDILTGNVKMVLNEIISAIDRLCAEGAEHIIFVDKMGLSAEERQTIRDFLGLGGVKINYDATAQPAQWMESAVSGVWFGVFYNQNQSPIMETIEICRFPQIAAAQVEDMKSGRELMAEKMDT